MNGTPVMDIQILISIAIHICYCCKTVVKTRLLTSILKRSRILKHADCRLTDFIKHLFVSFFLYFRLVTSFSCIIVYSILLICMCIPVMYSFLRSLLSKMPVRLVPGEIKKVLDFRQDFHIVCEISS